MAVAVVTKHVETIDVAYDAARTSGREIRGRGRTGERWEGGRKWSNPKELATRCVKGKMAEEVDRNVLRKYELHQKLGKGVRHTS